MVDYCSHTTLFFQSTNLLRNSTLCCHLIIAHFIEDVIMNNTGDFLPVEVDPAGDQSGNRLLHNVFLYVAIAVFLLTVVSIVIVIDIDRCMRNRWHSQQVEMDTWQNTTDSEDLSVQDVPAPVEARVRLRQYAVGLLEPVAHRIRGHRSGVREFGSTDGTEDTQISYPSAAFTGQSHEQHPRNPADHLL